MQAILKKSYTAFLLLILLFVVQSTVISQIPEGYYEGTQGIYGEELKQALHQIIKDHSPRTYSQLWQDFELTDQKSNGKVWDMYSDVPDGVLPYEYNFFDDQCGNYSQEGDCYNREHTWPSSWYGGNIMPMYSDLFIIVPTDGFVNMRRANLPYGEVNNPTWVSANGSKLGPNTSAGYNGLVFEPIDAYKGDFARGLLYMTIRYYGLGDHWPGSDMTIGSELLPWALQLMLQWHAQDPVSEKEIDRNNVVYQLQGNRNPFIDHPVFADHIWDESANITETALPIFSVYPTPASNVLYINMNHTVVKKDIQLAIYDIRGNMLGNVLFGEDKNPAVEISQLPPGIYFLHMLINKQFKAATKFIKN